MPASKVSHISASEKSRIICLNLSRFTKEPNQFTDKILPHIKTLAEDKAARALFRLTIGWSGREAALVRFNLSDIARAMNLDRSDVQRGLAAGRRRGYIRRVRLDNDYRGKPSYAYGLHPSDPSAPVDVLDIRGFESFDKVKVKSTVRGTVVQEQQSDDAPGGRLLFKSNSKVALEQQSGDVSLYMKKRKQTAANSASEKRGREGGLQPERGSRQTTGRSPKTPLPTDWQPSAQAREELKTLAPLCHVPEALIQFRIKRRRASSDDWDGDFLLYCRQWHANRDASSSSPSQSAEPQRTQEEMAAEVAAYRARERIARAEVEQRRLRRESPIRMRPRHPA